MSLESAVAWSPHGFRWKPTQPISRQEDFLHAFAKNKWKQDIVLLVDEFSVLNFAQADVRDEVLLAFRDIRDNQEKYAIRSIIAAGTFSILHLNPDNPSFSPFNISDQINNQYFTLEETNVLFQAFACDHGIMIEDAVVEDVQEKSAGCVM